MITAWLFCSLLFGVAHWYQGVNGVVRSTAAGLALGMAAILSGGLLLPMARRTLMDLLVLAM